MAGRKISFNDGSLITGGIFDFENSFVNDGGETVPWEPWTPPHMTHRQGLDLDLNQAGDINCEVQADGKLDPVFEVFRVILPTIPRENQVDGALLCESGGRRHIDFAADKFL